MIIQCPQCQTEHVLDGETLFANNGIVRCKKCGELFDAIDNEVGVDADTVHAPLGLGSEAAIVEEPDAPAELPFAVPEDLPQLKPSDAEALDIESTLRAPRSTRRRWYAVLATLLGLLLGLQIAWQQRTELLREFPQLGALCDMVACRPTTVYAPHAFEVLQRDIRPATNEPGTLSLSASVRNGASLAQRLPDIQLSLLDTNGNVLVRRRLSPQEYRFPPPPEGQLVAPAEVFTIGLDFADPGSLATGFTIDFL